MDNLPITRWYEIDWICVHLNLKPQGHFPKQMHAGMYSEWFPKVKPFNMHRSCIVQTHSLSQGVLRSQE